MKPIFAHLAGALALTAVVAACTQAPKPAPTPVANPTPMARPAPVASPPPASIAWIDRPQTPGNWRLQTGSGFTEAVFGENASEPRFALRCNLATRQIVLQRAGESTAPLAMVIRTQARAATLTASPVPGESPLIAATLAGSNPLFDAMAITRGRFAVEVAGLPTLYLPAWAEVSRVTEDCR